MKLAGQILLTLISLAAIQQVQAPEHLGIDERPYIESRFQIVVKAISKAENCIKLKNPGCIRAGDGAYWAFSSIEDGMRALEHEVARRRGHTIEEILSSYNPVPGYVRYVCRVGNLNRMEFIK